MAAQDFRVNISGGTVSLDDWSQAMDAPEPKLPQLSEDQKESARFIGMAEPEYARGVLAEELGRKRQREMGRRLGEIMGEVLDQMGSEWKLDSLVRKGIAYAWIGRFHATGIECEVEIPIDLADDVVSTSDASSKSRLERLLNAKLESAARRAAS